jgi:hypothetical protein
MEPTTLTHETGLALFVVPTWRPRFRESLEEPKRRRKLRESFSHFERHLDPRFATSVDPSAKTVADVHRLLVGAGAPTTCHVLSTTELDGQDAALLDALEDLMWLGEGFVSCIPGRLALYVGEDGSHVVVLRR